VAKWVVAGSERLDISVRVDGEDNRWEGTLDWKGTLWTWREDTEPLGSLRKIEGAGLVIWADCGSFWSLLNISTGFEWEEEYLPAEEFF
jgi:hypothetical protein